MDLKQFIMDFNEDVIAEADAIESFDIEVFTEKYINYLVEVGECINPNVCTFEKKSHGMRMNGYDLQLEDNALDLFISYFDIQENTRPLSEKKISDELKRIEKLLNKAVDGFGDQLDENDPENEGYLEIKDKINEIDRVRIYFLTNRVVQDIKLTERIIGDKKVTYHVCDIERIYQDVVGKSIKEEIRIKFKDEFGSGLRYIEVPNENDIYESYLTIINGKVIAEVYKKWGQRLIEKNIRSFLQAKGKVNKGIKDTIKNEPQMFMAYNNGLSTTADEVVLGRNEDGDIEIFEVRNWQIVNGGQTTASLYEALRKKENLDDVYVQVKITKINNKNKETEMVSLISRYANSQSKINTSDFSANNKYHISMEEYSRKIWVPNEALGKGTTKWFYERVRGQYLVELGRQETKSKKEKF